SDPLDPFPFVTRSPAETNLAANRNTARRSLTGCTPFEKAACYPHARARKSRFALELANFGYTFGSVCGRSGPDSRPAAAGKRGSGKEPGNEDTCYCRPASEPGSFSLVGATRFRSRRPSTWSPIQAGRAAGSGHVARSASGPPRYLPLVRARGRRGQTHWRIHGR